MNTTQTRREKRLGLLLNATLKTRGGFLINLRSRNTTGLHQTCIVHLFPRNMHIRQYDIVTAYLNGEMEEEIHMEVPKKLKTILIYLSQDSRRDPDVLSNCMS